MISFVKAHACGNDFLILDEAVAGRRHAELARKLCARNTSVGADGIEFLERRAGGEYFLRLINADGSEAELSGNGTRCVAAWLAQSEGLREVALGTHGGVRRCRVIHGGDGMYEIESGMGVPRVMRRAIELEGVGVVEGAMVNVGNPHFVVFVEMEDFSVNGLKWQELGEKISLSPLFPHGTNVEFVRQNMVNEIGFRIWERGVWADDFFRDGDVCFFGCGDGVARGGAGVDGRGGGWVAAGGVAGERCGDDADGAGGGDLHG